MCNSMCLAMKINQKKLLIVCPCLNQHQVGLKLLILRKKSKIIIDYAHTPDALENILKNFSYDNLNLH